MKYYPHFSCVGTNLLQWCISRSRIFTLGHSPPPLSLSWPYNATLLNKRSEIQPTCHSLFTMATVNLDWGFLSLLTWISLRTFLIKNITSSLNLLSSAPLKRCHKLCCKKPCGFKTYASSKENLFNSFGKAHSQPISNICNKLHPNPTICISIGSL